MRTSIFINFANLEEKAFRDDFDLLWKLPPEVRMTLIPHIVKIAKARTKGEKEPLTDIALQEAGMNPPEVLRVIKLLQYIYIEWNPIHDKPEAFLRDLGELQLIPEDKAQEAQAFLLDFLAQVEKDNTYRLEKSFARSVLPCYRQCIAVVDFRAVIRNPYGTGLDDKIEEYEPTCLGFAPVVLATIHRDPAGAEPFIVQLDEYSLQGLIDSLSAALKDLRAAKKSLPGGG